MVSYCGGKNLHYICQTIRNTQHMKKFTVTGYNRNNKAVHALTYNTDVLTESMQRAAMDNIQLFFSSPLRFEIKEV